MWHHRKSRLSRHGLAVEVLEDRTVPALVAAYGFDDGAGTLATDNSGNGLNGTLSNALWAAGKYGSALSFNGSDAWVTVADAAALHLTSGMTLEAWVDPTAPAPDWTAVALKERGTTGLAYALYAADGANKPPAGYINRSGTDVNATGTSVLPLNAWSHLAVTYGGGSLKLYVNGIQVASRSQTGNINSSTAPLRIGGDKVWGEYFTGLIDEVRVYNTPLTAAQIQTDMNTPVVGTPDTTPPAVLLTAPADGATVSGTAVAVTAGASDDVGVVGVQFLLDGNPLGAEDTTSPYSVSWNSTTAANGTHTLTAVARDGAGNKATSAAVTITVDNDVTAPSVSLTAPADGATLSGSGVQVSADASDNVGVVGVQFLLDGANLGAEDMTAPYSIAWDTTAATNGTHTLTAVAQDAAGNKTNSVAVSVTVTNIDDVPPTVSLTAPADNATVSGSAVTVSASASDNVGVLGVQFLLDGKPLGAEDTTSPYSITWDTTAAANGSHQITAVARDAAGNKTTATAVNVTVSNTDTTPPTVSLTSPANNATVSGSAVTVSASASDNVGVVGVQFLLDGNLLGAEDTTSPYTVAWDSTTAANGTHTIKAVARDAAGNVTTSATRTVTVSNVVTDPAVVGQWSGVMNWPLVAINAVLLDTGKVLMWDGGPDCLGAISATVWDPATNTFTPTPSEPIQEYRDIFCSSQTVLSDGRVLVAGGHECTNPNFTGTNIAEIFDPVTQTWTDGPDMADRRWYPTAITLANGKALVVAGSARNTLDYDPIPEMFDPATNTWAKLTGANKTIPNYAFMFQLPDGRVLAAGSDEAKMGTYALDVATQTWTTVDPTVLDGGSAVMYAPGRIMKAGSSYLSAPPDNGGNTPSAATTYVLDTTQGSQTWQQAPSMAYPRTHLNLTVLPDDTVLATGGSTVIGGIDPATGVLPAEMWNPTTQTWTTMANEARAREYHSTALLLPDGRVLVAGSGHNYANNYADYSAEIYSPPYLFKGARPTITSSPGTLAYGSNFFVGTPDGASIASVSLIRNGAVTHSFNTDQQFVPLSFTQATGGLTVTAPPDANTAPPGYYMLYVVNSNGVPSIAPFVRLPGDSQAPTTPANLTGGRSGNAVTLNWAAATDDVGVTRYDVYRSTTANFTPSAANRIGQATGTTYTDPGLANGTYYYKVTAADAVGNVSAPSNQTSVTVAVTSITMIQHATAGNESSQSQMSIAFPTSVTAGDFLIITGTAARPRSTLTITDTAGNTFVPAISAVSDPAQDVTANIWYVANARGGPDTITITPEGGADALEIHISEWSGVNKLNPLDQTSYATGNGTSFSSGSMTTTQPGELIFGYTFPNGNSAVGTGFTQLSYVNGDVDEYRIQSAAGPVSATFTQSPSDYWFALAATFRPDYGDTQPPTPPIGLTATAASATTIALSWTAATDDIGVSGYDVYRSSTPGFTPSPANLIGSAPGTAFSDVGLPTGTFYYRVIARDAAGNASTPSNEASTSVAGDTTPPAVSVTSPAGGATVSGSISVTATASDDVGVVGVQFLLDGNPLGAEDTASPYAIAWGTAGASNGQHTLSARARDAAGNMTTSAGVGVTVSNTAAPGLVAAYGFEEGTGGTAGDSSPNGLNGTIANAAWVAGGKFGEALSFNGTNSWVTVLDNPALHLTTGMTLEAWVKPTLVDGWEAVLIKEAAGDLTYGLYSDNFGNDVNGPKRPGVYVKQGGGTYYTLGTAQVALNTWTHLAATYDGSNLRLYVNGTLASTKARTGSLNTSTNPLRIGGDSVWSEWFNGLIDEVRVYDRALSAAEIQTDMNTPVVPGSPQLAAEGAVPGGGVPLLTDGQLAPVTTEAVRRWADTGLDPAQLALLSRVQFQVTDLNARGELGETVIGSPFVQLDDDGAGRGWFVDPTPSEDAEFGAGGPAEGYDLLTVVMHELGHVLGLPDLDPGAAPGDLMAATLTLGTRRSPAPMSGLADTVAPAFAAPTRGEEISTLRTTDASLAPGAVPGRPGTHIEGWAVVTGREPVGRFDDNLEAFLGPLVGTGIDQSRKGIDRVRFLPDPFRDDLS
jgi:hypothetical protein